MRSVKFKLMSKRIDNENQLKFCSVLYSTDISIEEDLEVADKIIQDFCSNRLNGAKIVRISTKFVRKKYCFIAYSNNLDLKPPKIYNYVCQ